MNPLPGGPAAERIWALVSGYPAAKRNAKRLFMLQAYVDESIKGDLLVMAGYIASVPQWAAFSDEWHGLLNMGGSYPRLQEFHMHEMSQSSARKEMVQMFYRIIESHVERGVAVIVNQTELFREYDEFPWEPYLKPDPAYVRNPYVHAFRAINRAFTRFREELEIAEPVEFVFDEHSSEDECRRAWKHLLTLPGFRETCGDTPIFRKSVTTIPLQSADLLAWHLRNWVQQNGPDHPWVAPFPWELKREMRVFQMYVSGADLRSEWKRARDKECLRRQGLPNPEYYFPEKWGELRRDP